MAAFLGQALAFLAELAALAGAGLLAAQAAPGRWGIAAGLAGAGLLALAWGRWAAPRARRRLGGMALLLFKAGAFGIGAAGLAAAGRPGAALVLLAAAGLSLGLTENRPPPVGRRPPPR